MNPANTVDTWEARAGGQAGRRSQAIGLSLGHLKAVQLHPDAANAAAIVGAQSLPTLAPPVHCPLLWSNRAGASNADAHCPMFALIPHACMLASDRRRSRQAQQYCALTRL